MMDETLRRLAAIERRLSAVERAVAEAEADASAHLQNLDRILNGKEPACRVLPFASPDHPAA